MESIESTFGSNVSRVVSEVLSEASQSIARRLSLPNYTAFVGYAQANGIRLIPGVDIKAGSRIGAGAFMVVYKASIPAPFGDMPLVVKRINVSLPQWESEVAPYTKQIEAQLELMSLELRVLANNLLRDHPNIVRLLGASWEELTVRQAEDGTSISTSDTPAPSLAPILILEEASGTLKQLYVDIAQHRRPKLSLGEKVSLWCDVANALSAVHLLGVIHGDIKPENILVFENSVTGRLVAKLSDFGGCLPLPDEEGTGIDSGLLGTEHWNAPEAYDTNHPYFRKPLRDYYSFGLVGAYILFEEELFGPARQRTTEERTAMRDLKQNYGRTARIIRLKLSRLVGFELTVDARNALQSISLDDDGFRRFERLFDTFRSLLDKEEITPKVFSPTARNSQKVKHHDNRIFVMCFAITRFLHASPEERRVDGLMGDLEKLIEDSIIGQALASMFGNQCWLRFIDYTLEEFNIWTISVSRQREMSPTDLRWRMIEKVEVESQPFDHVLRSEAYNGLPGSLQKELTDELKRKADQSVEKEKADYLMSMALAKLMRREITGQELVLALTECARLGSDPAKVTLNILFLTAPEHEQPFDEQEINRWLLEYVFSAKEDCAAFLARLQDSIPDMFTHTDLFQDLRLDLHLAAVDEGLPEQSDDSLFMEAIQAILDADCNRLRRIIGQNIDALLSERRDGQTLLHHAARYGQHECALLVTREFEVDISLRADDGMTALQLAAIRGMTETVTALINAGANIEDLMTPRILRLVANDGSPEILQLIANMFNQREEFWRDRGNTQHGYDGISLSAFLDCDGPEDSDDQPNSEWRLRPIFMAILGNKTMCLDRLLELGCSTRVYTKFESRATISEATVVFSLAPIHIATTQLHPWHLLLLLRHGEDPELRTGDDEKQVPLHLACVAYHRILYKYPNSMTTGYELPISYDLGFTELIDSRRFMIQLLIVYGAKVDTQDARGRTALMFCVTMPHSLSVMKYLVDVLRADVHIKDNLGQTCLHYAAGLGVDPEYLEYLVNAGCNVNEQHVEGRTPLGVAEEMGHESFAQILRSHGGQL